MGTENLGPLFGVVLGIGIFFVVIVAYTVFTTLQICEPSEVMIISGRTSMCIRSAKGQGKW